MEKQNLKRQKYKISTKKWLVQHLSIFFLLYNKFISYICFQIQKIYTFKDEKNILPFIYFGIGLQAARR